MAASDFGDFAGNEFFRGRGGEVAIVGGAVRDGSCVLIDSFWVFVSAEGTVDGFLPCECVRP